MDNNSVKGEINGKPIFVTKHPVFEAFKLQVEFTKILGGGFDVFTNGDIGKALSAITEKIEPDKSWVFIRSLLKYTAYDGTKLDSDANIQIALGPDLYTLLEIVKYVFEANFKDFFEKTGIGSLFQKV